MPNLAKLLFRGFDFEVTKQIILFSRILLLSPILLGLSNFFGSIVQYEKRFLLYSLSPFFYNLGIIFGTVFGANHFGIMGVVLGVVFGALLHFLVPLSYVFFTDSLPRITLNINFAEVKETAIISIPRALALSFNQIINIIFTIIASLFGVGAISVFNLAWNLQSVPLSVVGVSYSLAAFPTLSEHYAKKNIIECGRYIGESLRYIIFLVLPISALFIILRSHVIRVVLGSGAFDWSDTRLTSAVIALFALSFVFQSVQLFLTRAHYALGNTKTPLLIDMFGVVITVGAVALLYFGFFGQIILWFEWFLEIDNIAGAKIIILPIAFSIGEIYTAFTLWFRLDKETRLLAKDGLFKSFIQTLSASLIVMLVTFLALRVFDRFFVLNSFLGVLGHALVAGSLGIIGGIIFLILIKNSEMATVIAKLKSQ
jgi:putative peptidoglycan lipid II flippase